MDDGERRGSDAVAVLLTGNEVGKQLPKDAEQETLETVRSARRSTRRCQREVNRKSEALQDRRTGCASAGRGRRGRGCRR
jgi:hypothetical protein